MKKSAYLTSKIYNLQFFSSDKDQLLAFLTSQLRSPKGLVTVVTPNPEQVVISRKDPTFLHHLQSATVRIPDGIGLVIASRWLSWWGKARPIAERITGLDCMATLISLAQHDRLPVLIIGGSGYRERAISTGQYRLDSMVEWTPGYTSVSHPTVEETQALEKTIEKLQPAMVFFAFGAPYQEAVMEKMKRLLEKNHCRIALVVGGAPDILYGGISRAPRIVQQLGLEWLYRLWQQPWRWRRQLRLLQFIWITIWAPMLPDRY